MKKKHIEEIKMIPVKEWYEERKDGIYLIWEFTDKKRIERLTPYKELPYVELNYESN